MSPVASNVADPRTPSTNSRSREWRHPLALVTCALLLFETITGLFIYLGPFSLANQWGVLWHTGAGFLLLVPFVWYQIRHWLLLRRLPLDYVKLLGYLAMVMTVVAIVSGVVLTWQSLFGVAINYDWDLAHVVSGLAFAVICTLHIGVVVVRTRVATSSESILELKAAQRRFGIAVFGQTAVLCLVTAACALFTPVAEMYGPFPADYSWRYGDNPYSPSLVRTSVMDEPKAFRPEAIARSRSCGTSGCHEQILEEWLPSAHRYASMSMFFQAVQGTMAANNGPESTRYCAGCHDPVALFGGSKNLYTDDLSSPGADEGLTCVACHAIRETDVKGNANYTIELPERYLFELSDSEMGKRISDFLIRSYPRHHKESFARPLYKTPEYCAACHKQFIDEEINDVGWVQLQNQYDNWRQSHWNGGDDPTKTVTCRECHMRLNDSTDPASGDRIDYYRTADDGKHRDHRFIGANQFHPTLHNLPGAETQVRLTEEWLRGETPLPEIADKWTQGPSVPIQIVVPQQVEAGSEVKVKVVVTSNKVGHDFPTGPLDIIQNWIELVVTDEAGEVVYDTGTVDEKNFIREGSSMFKAEAIDRKGNLIDRHNLWEMVGVRYRRNLFPGYSDTMEFAFQCPQPFMQSGVALQHEDVSLTVPADLIGQKLTIRARLRYRKVDQFLINFLQGANLIKPGLTAPITDVSVDETTVEVVAPRT